MGQSVTDGSLTQQDYSGVFVLVRGFASFLDEIQEPREDTGAKTTITNGFRYDEGRIAEMTLLVERRVAQMNIVSLLVDVTFPNYAPALETALANVLLTVEAVLVNVRNRAARGIDPMTILGGLI